MEYITIQEAEAGVIYRMDAVNNSFSDEKGVVAVTAKQKKMKNN